MDQKALQMKEFNNFWKSNGLILFPSSSDPPFFVTQFSSLFSSSSSSTFLTSTQPKPKESGGFGVGPEESVLKQRLSVVGEKVSFVLSFWP